MLYRVKYTFVYTSIACRLYRMYNKNAKIVTISRKNCPRHRNIHTCVLKFYTLCERTRYSRKNATRQWRILSVKFAWISPIYYNCSAIRLRKGGTDLYGTYIYMYKESAQWMELQLFTGRCYFYISTRGREYIIRGFFFADNGFALDEDYEIECVCVWAFIRSESVWSVRTLLTHSICEHERY